MKRTKLLYLGLFLVAFFAVVVVLGSINAPPEQKVAEETKCVPSSLTGQALVNGLGKEVKIPLFPGAKRLTFTDVTAVQYIAKAYDSDIKSFYDDRLTSLCWQIKEQSRDQIVYRNDGRELKLSLLPNPAGKTVIDYVVLTTEGVLGTLKIAQAACTSEQYYCNGGCVAMGTSCPAPTDSSSCTSGTIWCTSSSGGSGWCQMPPCPSSTTSYSSGSGSGGSTCGSGQWWCNGACISMTTTCNGYYPNGTTSSSGTNSGSTTTCSGTYQQPNITYPACNTGTCPNGCTWDSSGCPNGCYTSSTSGNTSAGAWPTDQASCTSQAKFWCTPSGGGAGWCQSTACGTTSSACPSDQYWCSSSNTCIPNSSSCAPVGSGGSTSTYAGDANSCPSFAYSRWDSSNRRYCQLNSEARCDYNYPSYLTNGSNYTATNCPAGSTNTSGGSTSGCSSTQFMCNGACVPMGTSCSSQTWPADQASCTSQAKFWCTPSSGGAGWCQSTACSTNYSSSSCPAGQWMCNNACIPTTSNCNGYSYGGAATTQPTCTSSQWLCNGSCISRSASCNGLNADGTSTTAPAGTNCAGGYRWCSYTQSCVNAVQPCAPAPGAQQPTQPQPQQPQTYPTQQPMNCAADQRYCPSSNTCIPMDGTCGSGTTTQGFNQQQPPYGQPFGQYQPNGPGDQFGQGPGIGQNMGPSEEEQQKMQEQQFKMMKKGITQFEKGMNQMTKFVSQMKTKLAKSGVGIPAELTNALAKAPELIAKLKASKDMDEFQELMGDMQDIGMTMQEWGPKLGELQRLVDMMKNLDRDVKNMRASFNRVKTAAKKRPELAEPLKDVEALFNEMAKRVADVKALAKTDPESALDSVAEFYSNTEEFWNQVSFLDMVSNMSRGLTQANSQIKQIETKIRAMSRAKGADQEFIALLKEMVAAVKAALPELKAAMASRPIDYEEVKMLAEDFWMQLQELQNTMAAQGQSFYMPTVKSGAGINVVIPEGFISSPGGGGQSAPPLMEPTF